MRAPLALQPAGDVRGAAGALQLCSSPGQPRHLQRTGGMTATSCLSPGTTSTSWPPGRSWPGMRTRSCRCVPSPLGRPAPGAAHHGLRGLRPHWHARLGQPLPQRPPPLDCSTCLAAPTSLSVCSRARWSVWTWSGDHLSAQAAGPGCRSCRWPWRAVCSYWTCPGCRVPREGRDPAPSPSWCPSCSQTPPSPSWVSSTRPRPSPEVPGGGCETGLSLGPRHSSIPQLQVMGWRGTCGAWVRPTQPWHRLGRSCRAAWTCCRCTDRSALGVGWGLPALQSYPHSSSRQRSH